MQLMNNVVESFLGEWKVHGSILNFDHILVVLLLKQACLSIYLDNSVDNNDIWLINLMSTNVIRYNKNVTCV